MKIFYFTLLLNCFLISYAQDLSTDQDVVLQFRLSMFDPKTLVNNWTTTTFVCNWIGISCDTMHNRVKTLDLFNMNLTGIIPPCLGNLSFLVAINLSSNHFQGHLPRELGQLNHLKFINLSYNFLSGDIPSWFGRLDLVLYLNLRNNNFTGTIPPSLGNMSNLEKLDFDMNLIHGSIPYKISNLLKLNTLSLMDNQLSGPIPLSIFNISNLEWIFLSHNSKISGNLPEDMRRHLTKLRALLLAHNDFSGNIPARIGECYNLLLITFKANRFSGVIPRSFGNLSRLDFLALNYNNLEGKLPDMNLPNLYQLFLWENNLSGKIPNSICNSTKLNHIDLSGNSFSGPIPNAIGNLRDLKYLRLSSNNLTTESSSDDWSFLFSLTNCQNLKHLDLSFNPLDSIFPNSISNLSASLHRLHLDGCKIRGSIPIEIISLKHLFVLSVPFNELSGSIPATLGRLEHLQGLFLSHNKFQGSLPLDLCGLNLLNTLSLEANELDGVLPTCLGDLNALRHLNLSSNKFHSTIPSTFWSLKDILTIDLSSNFLFGSLPIDIKNLKVLIHLNLSRNLLSAHMPPTIGSLIVLQFLDLSRNRLEGPIPKSMGYTMKGLEYLDLSNNNLSGTIPKSLENIIYLNYLNLSYNKLEGEIPSGGPFVNLTAESFMNNSAFCGAARFHVPPCAPQKSKKKTILHLLTILLPIVSAIITIVAIIIVCKIRKQQTSNRSPNLEVGVELVPRIEWTRLSYYQLQEATNGFSEQNLLGFGSFGSVYKGVLSDGKVVAIKVFNLQTDGAFRSFDTECEVMRQFLHRNLVKIITSFSNLDFRALVLEFMPNGSLERWLYLENCFLDVIQRINIMMDVASALEYLHFGHSSPVIHCDIKPSNVLLDEDMVAHVGDFGIAKLLGEEESLKQTMTLATIGYMAPEYGATGIISIQSDIYSYGIMLMEIFTRKKPTDEIFTAEMSMKHWVRSSVSNDDIINIVDPNLLQIDDEYFIVKANCIASIFELALKCCCELPEDRVVIQKVTPELNKIKRKLLSLLGRSVIG